MKKIEVCQSPELIHLYDLKGKIVVVVDILRATSTMTVALAQGIKGIIPVATVEECKIYKEKGYLTAAERNGSKVDGFDLGNSPFGFLENDFSGNVLVMTTTNGTKAISLSSDAEEIVIGAFLNLTAVANYLKEKNNDVLIFCAGWKGHTNIEDTLFAGALVEMLSDHFTVDYDMSMIARHLYASAKGDLLGFVSDSSYCMRMETKGLKKDIAYCLQIDKFTNVPKLIEGKIKNLAVQPNKSASYKHI
jgi:2-phosphosulfolactate phosphatase